MSVPIKRLRGESTSPTKPESNVCTSCKKSVTDDDSLECVWCERLQHRNCAKISDDQYCMLVNLPTNIVYFCTSCFHKLSGALAISDIIDEVNSAIDKSLSTFELSLTNKFDRLSDQVQQITKKDQLEAIECQLKESSKQHQVTFSDLSAKVDALARDITTNSTQLVTLKSQLEKLHREGPTIELEEGVSTDIASSLTSESVATITVGVADEQRERDRRKLNLILHNVPESAKQKGPERKADNISMVNGLLHQHLGFNPTISNAVRLGKKSDRPRLLKISVATTQEKTNILRNCYKLRDSKNAIYVQKIFATPDLTPLEQKKDKILRQKLAEMNKDDKIYKIKNGVIVRRA